MKYLALGTNLEPRRNSLTDAKNFLNARGAKILAVSSVYETPALLPHHAADSWQLNYLNQVVAVEWSKNCEELLRLCKGIECEMGRVSSERWSPRPIDIDILIFDSIECSTPNLHIPHRGMCDRNFFLGPFLEVARKLGDASGAAPYEVVYKKMNLKLPQWMSIVNVTPDSFSSKDDSFFASTELCLERIRSDLENGAQIVDLGAESTRPGATVLSHQEEWRRLSPVLDRAILLCREYEAELSVDTYHPETMQCALHAGVRVINDVGGLKNPRCREIFFASSCDWVVMHNLGLPANKDLILDHSKPAHEHIGEWVQELEKVVPSEFRSRMILDPGIGFGKSAEQSRDILKHWQLIKSFGYRVLIGHSRKSFLAGITQVKAPDRDLETIALSLRLASEGVDILRIHNMPDHRRALLASMA